MVAHEAGRVACHASSLEWAVKSATYTLSFDKNPSEFVVSLLYVKIETVVTQDESASSNLGQFAYIYFFTA